MYCLYSPWQSCQDKANGEEVREPEVVGGDWGVLLGLDLRLVHEAASGLPLQGFPHVTRSVDPTIRLGILRQRFVTMAQDGLLRQVQVVLLRYHNKPNHYDQGRRLKIGAVKNQV